MDELIREAERNIRNSKELLKVVENRVAYQKNDLAIERVTKAQLEFYEGIHKELEYAKSCHELEAQLGCPLKVFVKLHTAANVYTLMGKHKLLKILDYCIVIKVDDREFYLSLYDYKITWWLKSDRSE